VGNLTHADTGLFFCKTNYTMNVINIHIGLPGGTKEFDGRNERLAYLTETFMLRKTYQNSCVPTFSEIGVISYK
jgi:hypothetical protein